MPYIVKERRVVLNDELDTPQTAGELNYLFTSIIVRYWNGRHNYQAISDICGALEGAKLEFLRRKGNDYEDKKIILNGDCY